MGDLRSCSTVIIPTYNRARLVGQTINSILNQTMPPQRIIVMDDGSSDNTADVVGQYGPAVEYIRKDNAGKAAALNLALTKVESEFVWIFDDDDIAAPYALERLENALRNSPECGFSYSSHQQFRANSDGTTTDIVTHFQSVPPEELFVSLARRCFVFQPAMVVRQRCYEEVGPFDETMLRSQDYEMLLRLARRYRAVETPGPVFYQRQHFGMRGSAKFPVPANEANAIWKRFDQVIMQRIRADCSLHEFLPYRANPPLTDYDRFAAYLQRGTILCSRGLWTLGAADIDAAVTLANELGMRSLSPKLAGILRQVFQTFGDNPAEFVAFRSVQEALDRIEDPELACAIKSAVSWGMPHRIRVAVFAGRLSSLKDLLGIYLQLASPVAICASLGWKFITKIRRLPAITEAAWVRYSSNRG